MTSAEYKDWLKGDLATVGMKPLFPLEVYERPALAQTVRIPTEVTQLLTDSLASIPALGGAVTLLIAPRPAERPRFSKFGGAYNSKAYSSYKQSLVEALKVKIFEGQIRLPADYAGVLVDFYLPVPKSWTKKKKAAHYGMLHRSKPDADNYLKAICDAMTEAKVFTDDGQVAQMVARKWYVEEGEEPRLAFTLHTLDDIINQEL